jgi:hypothetical protein
VAPAYPTQHKQHDCQHNEIQPCNPTPFDAPEAGLGAEYCQLAIRHPMRIRSASKWNEQMTGNNTKRSKYRSDE